MSEKVSVRRELLVATLAAIATLIVTGVVGLLDDVWRYLLNAGRSGLRALASSVSVPMWLLLLLSFSFVFLCICVGVLTRRSMRREAAIRDAAAAPSLDSVQKKILAVLRGHDGRAVRLGLLAQLVAQSNLRTTKGVDDLHRQDLVEIRFSYIDEPEIILTPKGRDYVLSG